MSTLYIQYFLYEQKSTLSQTIRLREGAHQDRGRPLRVGGSGGKVGLGAVGIGHESFAQVQERTALAVAVGGGAKVTERFG